MLFSARKFSTSCTGAYTAEIGAALIENTVNSMGVGHPPKRVRLDGVSCHESCLHYTIFLSTYFKLMEWYLVLVSHGFHSPCQIQYTQEIDASARQAIFDNHRWVNTWNARKSTAPHVFGDMLEQVPKGTFHSGQTFCEKYAAAEKAWLQRSQFCYSHNQYCAIPESDVDLSGLPCEDNSQCNINRLFFEGRNGPVYATYVKKHKRLRTPLLIVENTPEPCQPDWRSDVFLRNVK